MRVEEVPKFRNYIISTRSLFSSRDYERQQLSMQLEIIYRSKQEVRKVYAHDKESVFTLNVKKFLHLLQPQRVILNAVSDEEGKRKCSADLDKLTY